MLNITRTLAVKARWWLRKNPTGKANWKALPPVNKRGSSNSSTSSGGDSRPWQVPAVPQFIKCCTDSWMSIPASIVANSGKKNKLPRLWINIHRKSGSRRFNILPAALIKSPHLYLMLNQFMNHQLCLDTWIHHLPFVSRRWSHHWRSLGLARDLDAIGQRWHAALRPARAAIPGTTAILWRIQEYKLIVLVIFNDYQWLSSYKTWWIRNLPLRNSDCTCQSSSQNLCYLLFVMWMNCIS